ncbi:MAG TPA: plasma-membrane proton-efflux P-type ATPase [Candidatus Sulfotelmatobacter sp.]|nr:plasma-membrane proton-efflux P-type ATPase [Candidatus Sulfotelmatobacter sp.]
MAKPQRAPVQASGTPPNHWPDLAKDPIQSVQSQLGTTSEGLTQSEAQARLLKYGYNELPEERTSPLLKFLSYFWGPIPWMIEVAAILSAVVRHWEDFVIILTLLLMNAGVGFWEEFQAGNAVAALKAKLALHARVKRDGSWKTVPARELVPGDLMRVGIGEIVPADARLFEGDPIEVDQSALTGESLPVDRRSGDLVYSGSIVKQGEIDALVIATGGRTYFGKTAHLVETAHTVSHFQRAVMRIGDFLIVIALVLVAIILLVALFRGDPMLTTLQFALILTIAAVPVAMPAVLSVTMAVGARKLAEKKAIVTHLAAMEELAGIDVLCSDKTGTLTQNKLTLAEPYCAAAVTPSEIILAAALASPVDSQDPIDLAVRTGLKDSQAADRFRVLHFQPFDPVHKRAEALVAAPDNSQFRVTKGAVQVILALAANANQVQGGVDQAVEGFAARGFRSLGVARTNQAGTWQFLGVLPLFDPPRPDSKQTITTAEQMGVKVKMVTGDQLAIAKEMAHRLGLGSNIVDAGILAQKNDLRGRSRSEVIDDADGFAQVFPEHKYQLVRTLQQEGHIVGMTGDGVNDAPALKQADAGIAVSGASDAARAAADIALLTPGLSVIVDAIKESRKMFQRMNSYAIYRVAETIRLLLFMTLSILVFNFYPVTAAMLVLLVLLNDGPILAIAYDRVRYRNAPESWDMPLVLGISSVLGLAGVIATFGLFYLAERMFHLDRNVIQTFMFLKLAVAGHLTIFVTRTRGPFWSIRPAPVLFWSAVGTKVLATLAAVYGVLMAPISWHWALLIWGYALAWFAVNDRIKLAAYRLFDAHRGGLMTHFWNKHTRRQPAA